MGATRPRTPGTWIALALVQADPPTTMETFSPEFAKYWLAGQAEASDSKASGRGEDVPSASQREAFEALADRVVAARSIL